MNIKKLPVDYVQDVIDTSVTEKRRYHMLTNTDGTLSLDDVTTYVLKGSDFGMDDINQTNGTVNDVIDALEDIEDGTIVVKNAMNAQNAGHAMSADSAANATNASKSQSADHAINADSAKNATNATNADSSGKLSTARNINGVPFDGTRDITVADDTKVPVDKDFVLTNQQTLTFVNKVATISDGRITADSLADVYFTNDTISIAEKANITVETYQGKVELTAGRTPEGILKASIHIRVV